MALDDVYKSLDNLSKEEKKELSIIQDPVRWAEATLRNPRNTDEHLVFRPYQEDMLSFQPRYILNEKGEEICVDRFKVYRCGRRIGKTTTLAVEAIYHAFTRSNFRVLIVAPFESQISGIFDEIHKLISGTFITTVRDVKKPFIMEFSNESKILGFTAGASSSVKGSSIRGKGADLLIVDECDHGIDPILEAVIMPIWVNNKTCRLVMSSTPSGRHGLFWEICQEPEKFGAKEFYVPSTKIPGWDSEQERLSKKMAKTKSGYLHEYLAKFGELEEGVFHHKHIMKCLKAYRTDEEIENLVNPYNKSTYNPRMDYFMGVDWNEVHGVTLNILEKNPKKEKVRLWKKVKIEKGEFTQPEAVDEIIEWSKRIKFKAIYVDQGFGYAQDQWIRKYGKEHPESNINEIIKAIDYGGKIEIKDVVTNQKIKKDTKPFLVDNTVFYVENHLLEMPVYEDEQDRLVGAMRGYKVKRISARTNKPIYECEEEDHELDALFLALLAVKLETSTMAKESDHQAPASVVSPFVPDTELRSDIEVDGDSSDKLNQMIGTALPGYEHMKSRSNIGDDERKRSMRRSTRGDRLRKRLKRPKRKNI